VEFQLKKTDPSSIVAEENLLLQYVPNISENV